MFAVVIQMQTSTPAPSVADSSRLLEIIELKWLLAGHGLRIHVERLLHDPVYARRTLDCATATANPVLCAAVARLRRHLDLDPP